MAFRELMEGLDLPEGATDRYRKLEALGRMLNGELYDDLKYAFDQERDGPKGIGGNYVPIRSRRPSVDFNLAHEITQDTLAELFGDEQFPIVQVVKSGSVDDDATAAMAELVVEAKLPSLLALAYQEGVVGSVGIVLHVSDNGMPFYDVLPGKWCEPSYRSQFSEQLTALSVTYPISREEAEAKVEGCTKERNDDVYWYRYIVGPVSILEYVPLPDSLYARLGEIDAKTNKVIEFEEHDKTEHAFHGVTPAIYAKNLIAKPRELDGPCLWWPIRNICVELDYLLSQAGRGLRFTADPMLYINKGEGFGNLMPAGDDDRGDFGGTSTLSDAHGSPVRGASNVLEGGGKGADAKILEINAAGIKEEREYARDLREYALEVVGGMKARAEHLKGAPSGTALDKGLKPLRRLVRRQRGPYGDGLLVDVIKLTLYGFTIGAFDASAVEANLGAIPVDGAKFVPEWPNDDTLQGPELLAHVTGIQLAAGGSATNPKELIKPETMGAKLAADIGLPQPYDTIKGSLEPEVPPPDPQPAGGKTTINAD